MHYKFSLISKIRRFFYTPLTSIRFSHTWRTFPVLSLYSFYCLIFVIAGYFYLENEVSSFEIMIKLMHFLSRNILVHCSMKINISESFRKESFAKINGSENVVKVGKYEWHQFLYFMWIFFVLNKTYRKRFVPVRLLKPKDLQKLIHTKFFK